MIRLHRSHLGNIIVDNYKQIFGYCYQSSNLTKNVLYRSDNFKWLTLFLDFEGSQEFVTIRKRFSQLCVQHFTKIESSTSLGLGNHVAT